MKKSKETKCRTCGKRFVYYQAYEKGYFCSKKCIQWHPWNKGKKGLVTVSEKTRKKLHIVRLGNTNNLGKKRTEEQKNKHKLCVSRGSNHYCWKGGISKDKRTGSKYNEWRAAIFSRDNWTCQTCQRRSSPGNRLYLEAHHILSWSAYPEQRYVLDNGVTLCRECHKLTDNYKGKQR